MPPHARSFMDCGDDKTSCDVVVKSMSIVVRYKYTRNLGGSGDELFRSSVDLVQKFIWWAFDNTASDWQLAADAGEIGVDIAGGLTTFIDSPKALLDYVLVLVDE